MREVQEAQTTLAQAVLQQAVLDRDWKWLLGDEPSLGFWCEVAGVKPEALRKATREFRDANQSPWLTMLQERRWT